MGGASRRRKVKMTSRKNPEGWTKGQTTSTEKTLQDLKDEFSIPYEVKIWIPEPLDRAESPPEDCMTLYESYFYKCYLFLPLPSLPVDFISEANLSISQVTPRGLKHLIGMWVWSVECGFDRTVCHLVNLLWWSANGKQDGRHYCLPREDMRVIVDFNNKDSGWDDGFFWVSIDEHSVEAHRVDVFRRD